MELFNSRKATYKKKLLSYESLSQDNLMYYILGCDNSSYIDQNAIDIYIKREEKSIFLLYIKSLISNSHGNQHSTTLKMTRDEINSLNAYDFKDMKDVCLLISDSCSRVFNEKAQKNWLIASELLPSITTPIFAERFVGYSKDIYNKIVSKINQLKPITLSESLIQENLEKIYGVKYTDPTKGSNKISTLNSKIYSNRYDKSRFLSVDVISSNWTGLKLLHRMNFGEEICSFQDLVRDVVDTYFEDIDLGEPKTREWIKNNFINSKLVRNYTFNKSLANNKILAFTVQSLVNISYELIKDFGELAVFAYDEVILIPNDNVEETEVAKKLEVLNGLVKYEDFTVHAINDSEFKNKFIGVCKKGKSKMELKSVDPENLLKAYNFVCKYLIEDESKIEITSL